MILREKIAVDNPWDADKYTKSFSFVHEYGNDVLGLVDFDKVRTAIDLGCGNGVLTEKIFKKGVSVIGMDASADMLNIARRNYPKIGFILQDAISFQVSEPVDLVFSNAVFHWIDKEKQEDMLSGISQALKSNGQLVCEFGGYGNNRLIHTALRDAFRAEEYEYRMPFYFPKIGEYTKKVETTGLTVTFAALFDRMTELQGLDGMRDWIDMFVKTPFDGIDDETAVQIKNNAVENLRSQLFVDGKWYADYVRIRIKAIKK